MEDKLSTNEHADRNSNLGLIDFLGQAEWTVTTISKKCCDELSYIKSFDKPPEDPNDPYNERYPWNKLGVVSSGISQQWYWYKDDVIFDKCSEDEIMDAYRQMKDADVASRRDIDALKT